MDHPSSCPKGTGIDGAYAFCRMDKITQLPEELLSTIMGSLDVRSLCAARLVCKELRKSASGHLKALELNWAELPEACLTDFGQFAGVTRLTVSGDISLDSASVGLIAHPRIAPLVTHVHMTRFMYVEQADTLPLLMHLPKLHSLRLCATMCEVELLPVGLKDLILSHHMHQSASPLTRFTALTGLQLDLFMDGASVEPLTGCQNLRSLRLSRVECKYDRFKVVSMLTMLSSLALKLYCQQEAGATIFTNLASLTQLSQLELSEQPQVVTHESLACLSLLTNMTRLCLVGCRLDGSVAGSPTLRC
jgi:hypothetical protein